MQDSVFKCQETTDTYQGRMVREEEKEITWFELKPVWGGRKKVLSYILSSYVI